MKLTFYKNLQYHQLTVGAQPRLPDCRASALLVPCSEPAESVFAVLLFLPTLALFFLQENIRFKDSRLFLIFVSYQTTPSNRIRGNITIDLYNKLNSIFRRFRKYAFALPGFLLGWRNFSVLFSRFFKIISDSLKSDQFSVSLQIEIYVCIHTFSLNILHFKRIFLFIYLGNFFMTQICNFTQLML